MFNMWALLRMVLVILCSVLFMVTNRGNLTIVSKQRWSYVFPEQSLGSNVWHLEQSMEALKWLFIYQLVLPYFLHFFLYFKLLHFFL